MLTHRTALLGVFAAFFVGLFVARGTSASSGLAPEAFVPAGFTIQVSVVVPGSPTEVFDAFTGDVTPWWDHHLSKQPKAMYIEPRPGGGFFEIFDDAGNGVEHARVTLAKRGEALRLVGPLGLGGLGVDMEQTLTFKAEGAATRVSLVAHGIGKASPEIATAVEGVWKHFLVEQFEPYVKSGKHKKG